MFYYLRDGDPEIDGMMRSVCETGGGVGRLTDVSIGFRDWPETAGAAAASVATAKRQPRSDRHRRTKALVYRLQYNAFRRHFERHRDAVAVAWNGLTGTRRAYMAAARDAGRARLFLERAPLPGRVTVDPAGVNEVNSLPREAAFYTDWAMSQGGPSDGWRALGAKMTARPSRRADVTQGDPSEDLTAQPFVFCPLQVPDDTQLRLFGGWVPNIERFIALLAEAAPALPQGWHLRVKEHPSSKVSLATALEAAQAAAPGRIVIDNSSDTFAQVAASQAVITLNSSVGLQAFFHDRPVMVLGKAFFRIPGLVTPIDDAAALAAAFCTADTASYDADLRDAFMSYLDRVYYPEVRTDAAGRIVVDPDLVRPKIAAARAMAAAQ